MKKETKRKVLVVGAALALIAGVGATAGTTFAKYTESATGTGASAHVAKWGFSFDVTANLFGNKYDNTGAISTKDATDGSVVVVGSDSRIVVAPGTKGSMSVTVNGSAEVDAELKVSVTGDFQDISLTKTGDTDGWTYNPIKWKLSPAAGGTTTEVENANVQTTLTSWGTAQRIEAGTVLENKIYKLEWEWPWSEDDAKDTLFGKFASAGSLEGYTAVTELKVPTITVSVTQVNTAAE